MRHVGCVNNSDPLEPTWLPPPEPDDCLIRVYASSPFQKGGTLIARDVVDLEEHARRLCSPEGYRPSRCPRCSCATLHVHDYPERKALGNPARKPIRIVRFQCTAPDCCAIWRVIPTFVARFLWYTWHAVEAATLADETTLPAAERPAIPAPRGAVPSRWTVIRWLGRLNTSARLLVQILAALMTPLLTDMIEALDDGFDATRGALVAAYARAGTLPSGRWLCSLAEHVHRVEPGLRVM